MSLQYLQDLPNSLLPLIEIKAREGSWGVEEEEEDNDKKGYLTEETGEGKAICFVSPLMGGMLRAY